MDQFGKTVPIKIPPDGTFKVRNTIKTVYEALELKGYNPVNQIVAYIMSGDPTYITGHNNARNLMSKLEPDEILEILVKEYINGILAEKNESDECNSDSDKNEAESTEE